jgi:hypothetical protein
MVVTLVDSRTVPRLSVTIVPSGVPDPNAQFQQFLESLSNKIFSMSQELSARGEQFKYVDGLKVVSEGPPLASVAELSSFWEESHALHLLRGQIDATTAPTKLRGLIFLGSLAPGPKHSGLRLDMTLTPEAFARNQDSYSLVMLYALAKDAERLGKEPDVISAFLGEANLIGQQLEDPEGSLAPIKGAIDTMLRALREKVEP